MKYQDSEKQIIDTFKWDKKEKITDLKSGTYYIQYTSFINGSISETMDVYTRISNNKIIGTLFFNNNSGLMFINTQ